MLPLSTLNYLFAHQPPRRILDIGTQNMLRAPEKAFREFLENYGDNNVQDETIADLAHRSITRPGEETLYLSEVLEHTPIGYVSFDVCPGRNTKIFDLNRQKLRFYYKRSFDLVLNCGTSEHIFNQLNIFTIIHDAVRAGGLMYHQVPTTGRIDHGYFCYHPRFFRELAQANGYELLDIWYKRGFKKNPETGKAEPRSESMAATGIELRGKNVGQLDIPNHAICVLFKKLTKDRFRLPLEIDTRHAEPDKKIAASYARPSGTD